VSVFEEHEKRAWSVDFCRMDPTKLISGSDDTKGNDHCAVMSVLSKCQY